MLFLQKWVIKDVIDKKGVEGLIENFFISLNRKTDEEKNKDNYVTDKSMFDVGARWFGRLCEGTTSQQHDRVRAAMQEFAQQKIYDRVIYLSSFLFS